MRIKKLPFVISAGVLLMSTIGAAALYWHLGHRKSFAENAVSCRARLYLQKAQGGVPEVSWSELWELTLPGRGFHCRYEGTSLEASMQYSSYASEEDRSAGARIFRERCTGCHGVDGSGGPVGPSLTRPQYKHGDSDLAIYRVLRDGISGTAMPRAGLPVSELWQVTAHVKMLQGHSSADHKPKAPPLAIVSNE